MSEPPIRLCMHASCYPPAFGGQGIQYHSSMPAFAECNLHPTILTRELAAGTAELDHPIPVHRALTPGGQGKLDQIRRIFEIRRYFRQHAADFDLLYTQITGWDILLNLAYIKRLGLPVIAELVLIGGDDLGTLRRSVLGANKLRILEQIDMFVVISGAFMPSMREAGVPDERVRVIYNGVDLERYHPRDADERARLRGELGIPLDGRVVISAGSVIPRKGMDRVLRAWERVAPVAGRDLLLIVGPKSSEEGLSPEDAEYAESLRREADSGALAGTVRFVGNTMRVQDYMGASDAFLFLSHSEGLGIVILEALATGIPAIVSPLDGIGREVLDEGKTGFVMDDPDDAEAVGERLAALLDDPALCRELGERGRRDAESRFSLAQRARALSALYREVLDRRAAGFAR